MTEVLEKPWVKEMLGKPLLARLGTVNVLSAQPHVTPVWFQWDGDQLFISVFISTRKAREVIANPKISVCIDTADPTRGIILEGEAEVWSDPERVRARAESIYALYVGDQEVKQPTYQSWAEDLENRIICLRPKRAYAWGE